MLAGVENEACHENYCIFEPMSRGEKTFDTGYKMR
jgi:hypothetical protein